MKVLWAINCYERFEELRFSVKAIKHELPEIDVLVLCNSDTDENKFKGNGEDIFFHFKNIGHHEGTIDAYNKTNQFIDGYDYVISSHCDSWFTDYKIVNYFLDKMSTENKEVLMIDAGERGVFNDIRYYGIPLDFFILTNDAYRECFPMTIEHGVWAETHVGMKLLHKFHEDDVYQVTRKQPATTLRLSIEYNNLDDSGVDLISIHDTEKKKKVVFAKSPSYEQFLR